MSNLAPIILFAYNRPDHTLRCLESLQSNLLASESTLYIYCDGVKEGATENEIKKNQKVLSVISQKKWCKEVIIKKQTHNIGLRNSVISGVNEVLKIHKKAIIIEDDLVLSKYFLEYINKALNTYENDLSVSQISGHSFKLDVTNLDEDAYFLPLTTTWGWGTWKRVWDEIDFSGSDYKEVLCNKKEIKSFNLDNSYDYYSMLLNQLNHKKNISSWGIMFWLHTFKNKYLVLFPKYTLVSNNGFDGSGTHKANKLEINDFNENNNVNIFPKKNIRDENLYKKLKNKLSKEQNTFSIKVLKLINMIIRKPQH